MRDILVSTEHAVTTITFNRLAKKNSLLPETYRQLTEALREAAADDDVRVVLIRGDESVFCAGNDLKDFAVSPPSGTDAPVWGFITELASFPKPIIAAVCGVAVGIGATMLLHCDLVYLGENAKLVLPFTNLGVVPEAGSSLLLPQRVGAQRAAEILYFAEPVLPDEAVRLGLASRVLPVEEVHGFAEDRARRLAERPRTAILETKRLMREGQRTALEQQIVSESEAFLSLLRAPAAKEAFAAFFEGRSPDFASVGE